MATLAEIALERTRLEGRRHRLEYHFQEYMRRNRARLAKLNETEALLMKGLDPERIQRARRIIAVTGRATTVRHGHYADQNRSHVRSVAVRDAINDLVSGAKKIRREYFGVKNYGHFGDQREDHKYGLGPRHGSIVFSVGLTNETVKRLATPCNELTAAEIEDALYLLNALPLMEAEQVAA